MVLGILSSLTTILLWKRERERESLLFYLNCDVPVCSVSLSYAAMGGLQSVMATFSVHSRIFFT